ncbi:MAG: restriction endonuclease [Anaerolineaceae bacterium]|nr:restriction endonuclease [Anaerolineaceae bacterium]
MPFVIFFLQAVCFLWILILPGVIWVSSRRRGFWDGIIWAFRVWAAVATFRAFLYILDAAPGSLIAEPANTCLFFGAGVLLGGVFLTRRWMSTRRLRRYAEIEMLHSLSAGEFEELVADYFKSMGYIVRHTGKSGDHGVDLAIYTPKEGKWLVQCKRYRRKVVGEPALRDLFGAMHHYHADWGYLITTGRFSDNALAWAEGKDIQLVDGEMLIEMLGGKNALLRHELVLEIG